MKLAKTRLWSRLNGRNLARLMQIAMEGPELINVILMKFGTVLRHRIIEYSCCRLMSIFFPPS